MGSPARQQRCNPIIGLVLALALSMAGCAKSVESFSASVHPTPTNGVYTIGWTISFTYYHNLLTAEQTAFFIVIAGVSTNTPTPILFTARASGSPVPINTIGIVTETGDDIQFLLTVLTYDKTDTVSVPANGRKGGRKKSPCSCAACPNDRPGVGGGAPGRPPGQFGDPVDIVSGELLEEVHDTGYSAVGSPIRFDRHYQSSDKDRVGWYGRGWTASYETSVSPVGPSYDERDDHGVVRQFLPDGAGGLKPEHYRQATALVAADHLVQRHVDGHELRYDLVNQGRLVSIGDLNGNGVSIEYATGNLPSRIVDAVGRATVFTNDGRHITSLTLPGGTETWTYEYTDDWLTAVVDPKGNRNTYGYDTLSGRLIRRTNARSETMAWSYDALGRVTSITNEQLSTTTISYDRFGRRTVFTDSDGSIHAFEFDESGFITRHERPMGGVDRWTYNDRGDLLTRTDAMNRTWTYTYDARSLLLTARDPLTRLVTYARDPVSSDASSRINEDGSQAATTRDGFGNVLSLRNEQGDLEEFTYNARGQALTSKDGEGGVTQRVYDAFGNLTQVTTPLGATTRHEFDSLGRRTKVIDPLLRETSYTYWLNNKVHTMTNAAGFVRTTNYDPALDPIQTIDEAGRSSYAIFRSINGISVTSQTIDALGHRTLHEFDHEGREVAVTDPRGARTRTIRDGEGRPIQVVDPLGRSSATSYFADGQVQFQTNRLGHVTEYRYDGNGRLLKVIDALQGETTRGYDTRGRLTSVRDPMGALTLFSYDLAGRQTAAINPLSESSQAAYDHRGQLKRVTDPRGNHTDYTYDLDGRQVSVSNAASGLTTLVYDLAGQLLKATDPEGRVVEYDYDLLGRKTLVRVGDGGATLTTYNPTGTVASITDPNNHTTLFRYDDLDRLTDSVDPLGFSVTQRYDEVGNRIELTDQNANTTSFTYSLRGELERIEDPMGNAVTQGFDAEGQRTRVTNSRGQTLTYSFDALGRLTGVVLPGAEGSETFAYDPAGRRNLAINRHLTEVTTYDSAGRISSLADARSFFTSFLLDSAGNVVATSSSHGQFFTQEYGPLNLPTAYMENTTASVALEYNKAGQEVLRRFASGEASTRQYDSVGRIATIEHRKTEGGDLIQRFTYSYDPAGNRIHETEEREGGVTVDSEYAYSNRNELLSAQVLTPAGAAIKGYSEIAWSYDGAGNRLTQTLDGVTDTYTYNDLNQIESKNGLPFGYDADGNMTREPLSPGVTRTYQYDSENNLVRTAVERTGPSGVTEDDIFTYSHNADGREIGAIEEPDSAAPTRPRRTEERFWTFGGILEDRTSIEGTQGGSHRYFRGTGLQIVEELRGSLSGTGALTSEGRSLYFGDGLGSTALRVVRAANGDVAGGGGGAGDELPPLGGAERVTLGLAGQPANNQSGRPVLSDDGRYVAFSSNATNLVATPDTNNEADVFVFDRQTRQTRLVSVGLSGTAGGLGGGTGGGTDSASLSADGSLVAFDSGRIIVAGDTGIRDVYVRNVTAGTTERVSLSSSEVPGNLDSYLVKLSPDGRFILFGSFATNFVAGGFGIQRDLYLRDRQLGITERINVSSSEVRGDDFGGGASTADLSADGRFVVFATAATNLVPGDTNFNFDLFLRDRLLGTTRKLSSSTSGGQANGNSRVIRISEDGLHVLFASEASNLVPNDTNGVSDVFIQDLVTGVTERISVGTNDEQTVEVPLGPLGFRYGSFAPEMSNDIRYGVFNSRATNLDPRSDGTPNQSEGTTFAYDRTSGRCSVVALAGDGSVPVTFGPTVSGDGRWIALTSFETGIVPEDTDATQDIFVVPNPFFGFTPGGGGEPGAILSQDFFSYQPYGVQTEGPKDAPFTFAGYRREATGDTADDSYVTQTRHLRSSIGRWNRRDPAGTVDGPNLHKAMANNPLRFVDPSGQYIAIFGGGNLLLNVGQGPSGGAHAGQKLREWLIEMLSGDVPEKEFFAFDLRWEPVLLPLEMLTQVSDRLTGRCRRPKIFIGYSGGGMSAHRVAGWTAALGKVDMLATIDPISMSAFFTGQTETLSRPSNIDHVLNFRQKNRRPFGARVLGAETAVIGSESPSTVHETIPANKERVLQPIADRIRYIYRQLELGGNP